MLRHVSTFWKGSKDSSATATSVGPSDHPRNGVIVCHLQLRSGTIVLVSSKSKAVSKFLIGYGGMIMVKKQKGEKKDRYTSGFMPRLEI